MNPGCRVALLILMAVSTRVAPASDAADAALATDGAFAAMSLERGQGPAFEEFLADDAIVFHPDAVTAREWYATHEQGEGRLDWRPSAGASDCTGRRAVTTGPWTYTSPESDESASGHYLSIWRREPDGDWRVVLDNGVDHDPKARPMPSLESALASLWPAGPTQACPAAGAAASLEDAERNLNQAIGSDGLAASLARVADPGALAYRDDTVPGPIAVSATVDAAFGRGTDARSQFVNGDPESDFGYSYGVLNAPAESTTRPAERASYVRVWLRNGPEWRVAIDMLTPLPADSDP